MTPRNLLARVAVLGLVAPLVVFWAEPAVARMAHQTLADRRPLQAGPVSAGFPIDHVGVIWDVVDHHHGDAHDEDGMSHGEVRFRHHGTWGAWHALLEDGAEEEGQWASALVPAGDAEAYEVRGVPDDAGQPRAVAINTTDGPVVKIGESPGGRAGALPSATCRSRADWGADEKLRFGRNGKEIWPPEHHATQVATVHHTATANNDPDPAATVRAIYRYHAVDRGWGDIGYHYLVDDAGVVYEGRWSGTASTSCVTSGGDASHFAHEAGDLDADGSLDELTTAAHTGGANSGNVGIALLGTYTDVLPPSPSVSSAEDVLAELANRHGLDPGGTVNYVNPVDGSKRTVATISGHRDWNATECPGGQLYAHLPTIRSNVSTKMGSGDGGGDATTNTAPVANADSYSIAAGGSLTVAAPGVLANDTDGQNHPLSAALGTGPSSSASFALSADGSFTYSPVDGFVGDDSFTYTASDGIASSQPATVTIAVSAPATAASSTAAMSYAWFGGKHNTAHLDLGVLVTDDGGAPVAGATVTALVAGTVRTATTNSSGLAALASYRGVATGFCVTTDVRAVDASPAWSGAVSPANPYTGCQP